MARTDAQSESVSVAESGQVKKKEKVPEVLNRRCEPSVFSELSPYHGDGGWNVVILSRRRLMSGAASLVSAAATSLPRATIAKMIDPKSVSEQIMYSTTRIVGVNADGKRVSAGTGFFFNFPAANNQQVPVLVTNKHVVQSTPAVVYEVHAVVQGESTPTINVAIRTELHEWIDHPNNKIDLCGIPFGPIANRTNPTPFFRSIGPDIVPSQQQLEELDAIEDVVMAGYPNGLWDEENNYPLIRRGITASHPAVDFNVEGVPTTVVDIAAFPGSSGSPGFIYNRGGGRRAPRATGSSTNAGQILQHCHCAFTCSSASRACARGAIERCQPTDPPVRRCD
jgi:hypothetical protein